MENTLEVTFEGDHVLVIANGDKDYRYMEKLWREVATACDQHDCYNVLGLADTRTPVEAVEGYDLPNVFRDVGIGPHYRIAWVEKNVDARDTIEFVQTVLANRGMPGLVFETEQEARTWLLGTG
ncbi:MAG: hypothetical protein QNJ23_05520 [Woeseiaceae bacterium]|nr:hypothetical protein [Woeseiaceae bacterium]